MTFLSPNDTTQQPAHAKEGAVLRGAVIRVAGLPSAHHRAFPRPRQARSQSHATRCPRCGESAGVWPGGVGH